MTCYCNQCLGMEDSTNVSYECTTCGEYFEKVEYTLDDSGLVCDACMTVKEEVA